MTSNANDYILASTKEPDRVYLQARVWEQETEALFDRLHLPPDGAAVDLGCGAMGVLGPLARRMRHVVGVERDPAMLRAAQAYLEAENLRNVELREADALSADLPEGRFDVAHERFVLPYVAPQQLLNRMVTLVKPGGLVITQEGDNTSWNFLPINPKWQRFRRLLIDAINTRGDIDIGQKTFSLLREAGLEHVEARACILLLPPGHPYMRMPLSALDALRPVILAGGAASAEEIDELSHEIERCIADDSTVQLTFTVVQVWGRRP